MTDEMKKYLVIVIAVVSIMIAGFVFYKSNFGGGSRVAAVSQNVSLFCTGCGGFEISADEYRKISSDTSTNMMLMMGPVQAIVCPKCGKRTCYMAQKCKQCETIFVSGHSRDQNFPDRCPKCGFSEIEHYQKSD